MQFIILNNRYDKGIRFRIGRVAGILSILFLVAVTIGLFVGGMYFGQAHQENNLVRMYGAAGLVWQREVREQRSSIQTARAQAQQQLNTLAARLSKLQGHVLRIDALGARLANMAGLQEFEFDLKQPVGMGGPEPAHRENIDPPDFLAALDELSSDLDERADKLQAIEQLVLNRNLREQIMPAGVPVLDGWVSSWYGTRTDPVSGSRSMHEGVDFVGRPGSRVRSVADGIVTWSGQRGGYGNMVEISHGDGYTTRYAHNKENLVIVGERVSKGQSIATMGSTGRSTGTHVHFEVIRDGKVVNPKNFISVN